VLEAMACGTPVIHAAIPVYAETTGGASLDFPAGDPATLAAAVERLLADAALRSALSAQGLQNAARFQWAHSARKLVGCYRQVAQRRAALTGSAGSRELLDE
jgi:alpha-1,3-rhamnosyl/mannosyltransferase